MEAFLGKVTQHAMNYAIRSGIGITASFAIRQTSRLLQTVDDSAYYQELHSLQERLDGKIRIISPAIDLIELISARGNTSLESAVALTKTLRWDIQSLGVRLEKAASAEESSRKKKNRAHSQASHELAIRKIVDEIKRLLIRIEDAVPLINLAITTSGASLSTALPPSVSPSRLLQASTFLTAGDTQYFMNPGSFVQVGPTFTLSLYMLFAGHSCRVIDDDGARDTTWKEVIHKARVKLMRSPSEWFDGIEINQKTQSKSRSNLPPMSSIEGSGVPLMAGEGYQYEYAYHLEIVEDLKDGRVHIFEDDEPQPGPYGDVHLAGIRESLPIFQIGKIFYADTGKILNIGNPGETNSPVLLLKRDINAQPPRKMMQESERRDPWYVEPEEPLQSEDEDDNQDDIDQQIQRESSVQLESGIAQSPSAEDVMWRLPADLDLEWLAFEVYTDNEESESEDEREENDDSAYASQRPSSPDNAAASISLVQGLSNLRLTPDAPSPSAPFKQLSPVEKFDSSIPSPAPASSPFPSSSASPFGSIRSSLSLLEMLIRLTALQQFQQASHLSIPDELLNFFLEESSTTGAGGDGEERKRTRTEARRKVGFDPYNESPIRRHGEDYQYSGLAGKGFSPPGEIHNQEYDQDGYQCWPSQSPGTPEPWLPRRQDMGSSPWRRMPEISPSSPLSPQQRSKKSARPLDRLQRERSGGLKSSPLGRGRSIESDSSLGTSPQSTQLVGDFEEA